MFLVGILEFLELIDGRIDTYHRLIGVLVLLDGTIGLGKSGRNESGS